MRVLAIANHKGGVGKTTTAAALGSILASQGHRILLVDLDAQANLTSSLLPKDPQETIYNSIRKQEKLPIKEVRKNLHLCPSSLDLAAIELELAAAMSREFILKDLLEPVKANYDFVILDCSPSLGLLTINAFVAADEVIIPMTAEPLPCRGLSKIEKFIEMTKKRLNPSLRLSGILITRWEKSNVSCMIEEDLRRRYGEIVFVSKVRKNIAIAEATLKRTDIASYSPNSNGTQDYKRVAQEFVNRINQ